MQKDNLFSLITQEQLIFLGYAAGIIGLLYIWDNNWLLVYKIACSTLILTIFLTRKIFLPLKYAEGSLRNKIQIERERLRPDSNSKWQWDNFRRLYDPSPSSLIIILILGVLINLPSFLYTGQFDYLVTIDAADKAGFLNNFIAIHAGIGAIIFAFLIFVAESLRDDSKERASVLLKESSLFPLTVLEIITLISFIGFKHQNLLVGVPILIVGCLVIFSLYRLMKILLSPYAFKEKRMVLLKDRVKRSINEALNERIGNNILHGLLNSGQIALTQGYLTQRDKRNFLTFKLNEIGIIKDINIKVLEEIGELVEKQANSKGFSFFENKPELSTSSSKEGNTEETKYYVKLQKWDATLTKFYRHKIDPEENTVLAVSKKILDGDYAIFEDKINGLLQRLFVIDKEDNFSEEIKLELEALRDQFVEAVQQTKITKIDYFKNLYISLAETFLELINEYGGGYTPEQAKKEVSASAFNGGWPEMDWLDDHLRDVYKASIVTLNSEIIRKVAFVPIAIAIRGMKKNDHFIFQKFIKYARSLHYEALEIKDNESLKEDLADRSIMWLKELGDYYIAPEVEDDTNKIQFAFQILLELQGILKHSFDKVDIKSFEKALAAINTLLKRFKPAEEHLNVEHFTWELEHTEDQARKEEIQKKMEQQAKLEKVEREFKDNRRQFLFGFTAWVFKIVRRSNLDPQGKKIFFEKLRVFQLQDIKELTEVFIKTSDHDTQDNFGWAWWDVIPDGVVRTMDFGSDLEYLYILLSLEILSNKTPKEIESIKLPPSRDLAFLAETNSTLRKKLDAVAKGTAPNFDAYISKSAKEKTGELLNLIEKAEKDQEEKERIEIMDRPLDPKKVDEFWNLFSKEFYEYATLRFVFKDQKKFIDKSQGLELEPTSVNLLGINQIDGKEAFFESWHVSYIGWGEQQGAGFGRSEDISIYEKLSKKLKDKRTISFIDFIPTIEDILQAKKFSKPYIFTPSTYDLEIETLRSSEKFIPRWHQNKNHKGYDKFSFYTGFLNLKDTIIPIFRMIDPRGNEKLDACLVDMDKIGTFIQYPPLKKAEDKNFQKDIFMFRVIDLNLDDDKRKKILDENAPWLKKKTDPEAYLKGKVLINIYSKSELKIADSEAGVYLKFKDRKKNLSL